MWHRRKLLEESLGPRREVQRAQRCWRELGYGEADVAWLVVPAESQELGKPRAFEQIPRGGGYPGLEPCPQVSSALDQRVDLSLDAIPKPRHRQVRDVLRLQMLDHRSGCQRRNHGNSVFADQECVHVARGDFVFVGYDLEYVLR